MSTVITKSVCVGVLPSFRTFSDLLRHSKAIATAQKIQDYVLIVKLENDDCVESVYIIPDSRGFESYKETKKRISYYVRARVFILEE